VAVTTRAVQEVMGSDFQAEVLEVRDLPPPSQFETPCLCPRVWQLSARLRNSEVRTDLVWLAHASLRVCLRAAVLAPTILCRRPSPILSPGS